MAKEIKAGIVITAQDRTAAGIGKTRKGLDSISQGLNRIERHAKLAAGALVTVSQIRNLGAHLLRSYSEMEDGLVAVAKTADLSAVEVRRLGEEIDTIGQRLPVARKELLDIAAAAGQLGVKGVGNLSLFTETVGKLGLASNLSGDEAATSLARILTVTGEGIGQVDRFASAIVSLGNNFAASEREIAHHATRLATGTALYGVAAHEAAALGATLAALGLEAELGGTAVARAFASIDIALREGGEGARVLAQVTGRSVQELKRLFAEDAVGAFQLFVEGLGRTHAAGGDLQGIFAALGLDGQRLVQVLGTLAKRPEELSRALKLSNREVRENNALTEEAIRGAQTFSAQMQLVRNDMDAQAAVLGENLAPAVLAVSRQWDNLAKVALLAAAVWSTGVVRGYGRAAAALLQNLSVLRLEGRERAVVARAARMQANAAVRVAQANVRKATTARTARTAALGLAAAERQAAQAAQSYAAATVRGGIAGRAALGIVRTLGGPLGILTTALTVGATAWALWGRSARDAAAGAEEAIEQQIRALESSVKSGVDRIDELIAGREAKLAEFRQSLQAARSLRRTGRSNSFVNVKDEGLANFLNNGTQSKNDAIAYYEAAAAETEKQRVRLIKIRAQIKALGKAAEDGGGGGEALELGGGADAIAQSIAQLKRKAALTGEASEEARVLYDLEQGALTAATDGQRAQLILLAQKLDAFKQEELIQNDLLTIISEQDAAHQSALQSIQSQQQALASPYQQAVAEIEKWKQTALAGLDETRHGYQEWAAEVEDIYRRRLAAAAEEATERQLRAATDWQSGAQRALQEIARDTQDMASSTEQAILGTLRSAEDAWVQFARTGKFEMGSLANYVVEQLARMTFQQTIQPGLQALLNWGTGLLSGPATMASGMTTAQHQAFRQHSGGIVGLEGVSTQVPAALFAAAPRLHAGGLAANEVPTILERGEGVFTAAQMRALGPSQPPKVEITFENRGTPQREVAQETRFDGRAMVVNIVTDDLDRGGPISARLRSNYGLREAVT